MLAIIQVFTQGIQDHLQMFFVAQEVGIADIHENGADIMLPDIAGICLLDLKKVFIWNTLFIGPVPSSYILLQLTDRCMQIDEDIRLDQLGMNNVEQFLIEAEFLLRQIDLRE